MGLLLFATLLGAGAGFLGWALAEPFAPGQAAPGAWQSFQAFFSILVGALIGAAIGGLNGKNQGSRVYVIRGVGLGFLLGGIGGFLGLSLGSGLGAFITNNTDISSAPYPLRAIGRALAFALFGAGIGSALGAASLSARRCLIGAMGGACGGILAGLLFDPVATILAPLVLSVRGGLVVAQGSAQQISGEVGGPSRALLGIIMGGSIGLFTSWFLLATRQAWVRLVLGRNEGREWLLDRGESTIGRSETAHIPLFEDMNVAPVHAVIRKQGAQYILVDAMAPLGIGVNGQRVVGSLALFDGAHIQIGTHTLIFMMKSGAARRAAEAARASGPSGPSTSPYAHTGPGTGQATVLNNPIAGTPMGPQPAPSQPTIMTSPLTGTSGAVTLVALDGPIAGQRFPLTQSIEIGREIGAIQLGFDPASSRRHAMISVAPNGIEVIDLGSTNGTFVNGQRIQKSTIRPGDVVKIGSTSFRIEA